MTTVPFVGAAPFAALAQTAHTPTLGLHHVTRGVPLSKRTAAILAATFFGFFLFMASARAGTPYLTNLAVVRTTNQGVVVSFRIGGTNDVPLNMYQATSLTQALWPFLGVGFASTNLYTFSNQPSARAF